MLASTKSHRHLVPSESHTKHMEDLISLLTPFEIATVMVSSERKPTAGLILPIMSQFLSRDVKACTDDSTLIKKAKNAIHEDNVQTLLKTATILDPRFKSLAWMCEEGKTVIASQWQCNQFTTFSLP